MSSIDKFVSTKDHKYKDFSELYVKPEDFDGKKFIAKEIGSENLHDFEKWAFGSAIGQYDEAARFLWNHSHRNMPLTGSLKEALSDMVRLWKAQ